MKLYGILHTVDTNANSHRTIYYNYRILPCEETTYAGTWNRTNLRLALSLTRYFVRKGDLNERCITTR